MGIEHISDTARWVAWYRAMETDRPDAIFRDPFARRLAGPAGEAIVDAMPRGRAMAWVMIVRTAVFDDIIGDVIQWNGATRVVNLAAGLDTRPWRMKALRPDLEWIDVDLPAILEYKTNTLAGERPVCRYEAVAADLTNADARHALLARLQAAPAPTLVVTEGLLIYLTEPQVGDLARDMFAVPHLHWWLIDLASPRLLAYTNRHWGQAARDGQSPFQFAPANGTAFFEPFGWYEISYRSIGQEARRLKREMRLMWLWRLLARTAPARRREEFARMSGAVLLESARPPAA